MDNKRREGPIRIGCVSYLNAYPLWKNLPGSPIFAPPSRLYELMEQGECDLALLPSASLLTHPDWEVVSKTCIASFGEVESVKLFYRPPLKACRRIFLDPESMTSNLLLKCVLKNHFGLDLEKIEFKISAQNNQTTEPAGFLFIGDKALGRHFEGLAELDLGAAWRAMTGKPFVFALWLGRPGGDYADVARDLEEGLKTSLHTIDDWLPDLTCPNDISLEALKRYFTQSLQFEITPAHKEGLERFLRQLKP